MRPRRPRRNALPAPGLRDSLPLLRRSLLRSLLYDKSIAERKAPAPDCIPEEMKAPNYEFARAHAAAHAAGHGLGHAHGQGEHSHGEHAHEGEAAGA